MKLHAREAGSGPAVVLLHGLFGSNENLGGLARGLVDRYRTIGLDLRNHGRSPHAASMNYAELADDVAETMDGLGVEAATLIGHSLGGKTAMEFALLHPGRVDRLVVLDIAPVAYDRHHDEELGALLGLDLERIGSRRDADEALAARIPNAGVRQFLLKNLRRGDAGLEWRLPLATIETEYPRIAAAPPSPGAFDGPALFLRGGESDYITAAGEAAIRERFPAARIETIEGTHHWLHVEAVDTVVEHINTFLAQ